MNDKPLTAAELGALLARAEAQTAETAARRTSGPRWAWESALAAACRQALAQLAEVERLRKVLHRIAATATQDAHGDYLFGSCQQIEMDARAALREENRLCP